MDTQKVVWGEGTLIAPQHFQQQERYFEALIAIQNSYTRGYHWGFLDLEFNHSSGQMGVLEVVKTTGYFQNGVYFNGTSNQLPRLRIKIPPNSESRLIYLAWSGESSYVNNYEPIGGGGDTDVQYVIQEVELQDATEVGLPKRSVLVARKNIGLVLAEQLTDDMLYLPIARILSSNQYGEYVLDESFVPPFLNMMNNDKLMNYFTDIHNILKLRAQALSNMLINPSLMSSNDVRDFLILQTINRYQAYMHHVGMSRIVHPCDLYENWLKLYGDLSTFETDKMNLELPQYHHEDLEGCFASLFILLKRALSLVLEQKAVPILFEQVDDATKVAITPDRSLLNSCRFILAVNADLQPDALKQKFPATVKIGSVEKIKELVAYHLPGIKIWPLATAPRELPYYSGFSYFELDKTSEMWLDLHSSSGIALHLAGEFPDLQIEFWAIKPVY